MHSSLHLTDRIVGKVHWCQGLLVGAQFWPSLCACALWTKEQVGGLSELVHNGHSTALGAGTATANGRFSCPAGMRAGMIGMGGPGPEQAGILG